MYRFCLHSRIFTNPTHCDIPLVPTPATRVTGETLPWSPPVLTRSLPPHVQEHKKATGYDLFYDLTFVVGIANVTHLMVGAFHDWYGLDTGGHAGNHSHANLTLHQGGDAANHSHATPIPHHPLHCHGLPPGGMFGLDCGPASFVIFLVLMWMMMELWLFELTYQQAFTGGDDILNRVLCMIQIVGTGWFCFTTATGFGGMHWSASEVWNVRHEGDSVSIELAFCSALFTTWLKYLRSACHKSVDPKLRRSTLLYLGLEMILCIFLFVPTQVLFMLTDSNTAVAQITAATDARVIIVIVYLVCRKVLHITPFCCCPRVCVDGNGAPTDSCSGVRAQAGRLWNVR